MSDEMEEKKEIGGGIARQQYWEECTVVEKAERSREQIKDLQRRVEVLTGIIDQLTQHSHIGEKIVIPFDHRGLNGERAYRRGRKDKEVYF